MGPIRAAPVLYEKKLLLRDEEKSPPSSSWSYLDRIVAEPLSVSAIGGQRSGGWEEGGEDG